MTLKWHTININIDVATGEQITDTNRKKNYLIIKKTKTNVTVSNAKNTGTIEYTNECRRKPKQLDIFKEY